MMLLKQQRLPLVTLGLEHDGKDASDSENEDDENSELENPNGKRLSPSSELKKKGSKRGCTGGEKQPKRSRERSGTLFGVLPEELCLGILSKYVGNDSDLLAVRASCFFGERTCSKIFASRKVLTLSQPMELRVATIWSKSLTELRISGSSLNDSDLCGIARGCRKIAKFSASSWSKEVSAYGLGMFFSFLNNLEEVELRNCDALDDWAVTRLAQRCPKLRCLSLSGCQHVGIRAMKALSEFSALQHVDLSHCPQLSGECLETLLRSNKGQIRTLSLAHCSGLSGDCLKLIGTLCPALESLDLSHVEGLSDSACTAIARGCPNLVHVNLSGCPSVKAAACVLFMLCRKLEHINLSCCPRVSDICFLCISDTRENVKHIDVTGCGSLTSRGMNAIKRCFPNANWFFSLSLEDPSASQ